MDARKTRIPLQGWTLIASATAHNLLEGFYDLAMPLLMLQLTGSATMMSLMFAMGFLTELLIAVLGGAVTDRLQRRTLLIAITCAEACIFAAAGFVVVNGNMYPVLLIAVAAVVDLLVRLYLIADVVALPDLVDRNTLPHANGILHAATSASTAIAPALAGVIIGSLGVGILMVISALLFVLLAAALRRITWPTREKSPSPSIIAMAKRGFTHIWSVPLLRQLIFWRGLLDSALTASFLFFVFYMRETLGLPTWQIGVASSFLAVGGILGGLVFSRVASYPASGIILSVAAASIALCIALVTYVSTWWALSVLFALITLCLAFISRIIQTYFQLAVPREILGRVVATSQVITTALGPLIVITCGIVAEAGGVREIYLASAAVFAVLSLWAWRGPLRYLTLNSAEVS